MILLAIISVDTLFKAKADIRGFNSNIEGTIWFFEYSDGFTEVRGTVRNLKKNKTYAIHIHEFGDCSNPDASGGHFDPYKSSHHGSPEDPIGTHHSGDLPNITSNSEGVAEIYFKTKAFTIEPSRFSILGRSVILHEDMDDHKSQPAGNSGKRIACGIIGIVK